MSKVTEMAVGLMKMEVENELMSIVRGNRNWVIKTLDYGDMKVAHVGKIGAMRRYGEMGEMISAIVKYNIRWYEYTYKRDFDKTWKMLEDNGYKIYWIQ